LDIAGKPVVMEEFGIISDYVSEENAAFYYRRVLHNTRLAGATGWLAWNNTDYDDLYDVEPYLHHPFEMHFGLIDKDGRPKSQAVEVRRFGQLLGRNRRRRLSRPDASVALVVSSFLERSTPSPSLRTPGGGLREHARLLSPPGRPTRTSGWYAS